VAPAVLLSTAACFATRGDVRILQSNIASLRADMARRDSIAAAQTAVITSALTASIAVLNDSLKASNARVNRWQANATGDLRSMTEQLLMIQELVGQSATRLRDLRADLEARQNATVAVPTAPGDTTKPVAGSPGPNQLYQLADDQLRRGSWATARAGFEELLRLYPTSELAPDAQFNIAESYAQESNIPQADSGYVAVVTKYPKAPAASRALYKHALILERAGKAAEAKAAFERVIKEYPNSDEATLAKDHIRGD
jgi:tol-pal system protein YbgF